MPIKIFLPFITKAKKNSQKYSFIPMGLLDFLKKDKKSEDGFKKGLEKTSGKISSAIGDIFSLRKSIGEDLFEELEETLISADMGPAVSAAVIESVRKSSSRCDLKDPAKVIAAIKREIKSVFDSLPPFKEPEGRPYIILVSGVNGVGKTTSIAKLADMYSKSGKKVMLAAGDTFRAAAAGQLQAWGERLGVPVLRREDGSDPAAVIYDAVNSAKSKNIDIVIADTAGRLHTKSNLMQELIKIRKVASREIEGAPHENLLVLDSTAGRNSLTQAKNFKDAIGIDGVILTKLDGTAKGGVAVSVAAELGIPVRYVGFGEGPEDLRPFDAQEFLDAIFGK